jgi:hypothetical protein
MTHEPLLRVFPALQRDAGLCLHCDHTLEELEGGKRGTVYVLEIRTGVCHTYSVRFCRTHLKQLVFDLKAAAGNVLEGSQEP